MKNRSVMYSIGTVLSLIVFSFFYLFYGNTPPGTLAFVIFGLLWFCALPFIFILLWEKRTGQQAFMIKMTIVLFLFVIIMALLLGGPIYKYYSKVGNVYVHDSVLQTEIAIARVLQGVNFYTEDYKATVVEDWGGGEIDVYGGRIENPAIYHYAYLPFCVISSAPLYIVSHLAIGFYDQRFFLLVVLLATIIVSRKLLKNGFRYLLFFVLFFLNPWSVDVWAWGLNDISIIFLILLSFFFLQKRKTFWATIIFALACAAKQTAWFLLPFYFFYIYQRDKSVKEVIRQGLLWLIVVLVIVTPFILWDATSFFDDTMLYLSGKSATSYPIAGVGFGQWLLVTGRVNFAEYFPFWFFQLIVGLPVLWFLLRRQKSNNTLGTMLLSYTTFLAVFWIFSRYFNWTHLVFLIQLFILGLFIGLESEEFRLRERVSFRLSNKK